MAKARVVYVCSNCGRTTPAYMGKCPQCGEFGTMEEQVKEPESRIKSNKRLSGGTAVSKPIALPDITSDSIARLSLPIAEMARVLGGGIVPGSIVLVGGDPGIGKSTLLLQAATMVAEAHGTTLYVSGEESTHQIKMRADRMGVTSKNLLLVTETNLQTILTHVQETAPVMVIIDSIQTTYTDDVKSSAGSVTQVRECASRLQELAKTTGVTVFLVGHVTKEGAIAGPRVLEHIVDTVLYLGGDPFHRYRLLRSVKNRFGATSEVGVFEMVEKGMKEVSNPSEAFLAERQVNAPGSTIAVTIEGTRPLLVEVQALASATTFSNPRRTANGVDYNRLLLLTAVLTRRVNLNLYEKDIFINIIGGLQIDEPATDLSVAVAIASSVKDRPVHADMAFMGEIGLSGELRTISQPEARLREAVKLGFKRCVIPRFALKRLTSTPEGLQVIGVRTLYEAIDTALIKKE